MTCQAECEDNLVCVGVDVDLNAGAATVCWLHLNIANLDRQEPQNGVTLWILEDRCPRGGSTTGPATSSGPICIPEFTSFPGESATGATIRVGVDTEDGCLNTCVLESDCVAADVTSVVNNLVECWIHRNAADLEPPQRRPLASNTLYILNRCACTPTFNVRNNTSSSGGQPRSPVTLLDCQRECDQDPQCVALDADFRANAAAFCWVHYNLNGLVARPDPGVYQYVLESRCTGATTATISTTTRLTTTRGPTSTTTRQSTTASFPCSLFERVDSNANGGRNIGKLDKSECRRACEEDVICLAAEWNSNNRECYTHNNLERRKRNTCCVAWEKLCLPNGCQDTFVQYPGTRGSNGVPQAGVSTATACQAACLATALCTGIDYVSNEGSPCRIYTTSFGRVTDNQFSDGYVRLRCMAPLVATTPPPTQTPLPAACLADLVLVLDSSGSINENQGDNWNTVKLAIKDLMDSFPIGQDRVRVGIVTYSNNAKTIQFLNETTTLADLNSRVDGLEYRGGKTNTPRGLQVAVNEVFQVGAGRRNHVKDVLLLLTDGKTSPEYANDLPAAISALRNMPELQVFGLGVGNSVELSDLQDIASDPDTRYVHTFATFANLAAELRLAVSGVCSGVTTLSPTTNRLQQG